MLSRVLLVEDQGLVRAGMRTLLHIVQPEVQVIEAGTFEEAEALLAQRMFDIVFLDIELRAAQSGLDLLVQIRDAGLPCKVIMLAASEDRELILRCIASGASGYIVKGCGDETVFARTLATVFQDGVFLPDSLFGHGESGLPAGALPIRTAPSLHPGWAEMGIAPRMLEVLYYVCQGLPNKSIARLMDIGEGTVRKTYVSDLLRLFKVTRRTELMIEVSRLGLRIPRPEVKVVKH